MMREVIEACINQNPVEGSVPEMRAAFAALAPQADEIGEQSMFGGVPARVHRPDASRTVLLLHGGGYVFGSSLTHAAAAACLARCSDARVIVPDYRLAPDHQWPAPLDDALAVLDALEGPVSVVGNSAGGHLALNLALARPDRVARLALISPNTDRTGQSTTRQSGSATDLMNSDEDDGSLGDMAFGDLPKDDTGVSPLLADLTGLPPLYLTATPTEVLLDDTLLLARAAAIAGVKVTLEIKPDLFHMWTLWPAWAPAEQTWKEVATHIRAA